MKRNLIKAITFLICIGVLGMAINTLFGYETITYLQKQQINLLNGEHFYIWKFNFWGYVQNIQLAITNLNEFTLNLPNRQWSTTDVANNLLLLIDYVIVVINVLLYPFRVGAYLLNNMLALLGINNDLNAPNNGLKWLYIFVNNVIGLEIPYI